MYLTKNKQKDWLARHLTIAPKRKHKVNMFEIRYQLSTTCLNHKIRVQSIIILIYILYRRSLISGYLITLIRQLSKAHEIVFFISFYYIDYLNIFHQTLRISKGLLVALHIISKTKISIVLKPMIFQILRVQMKQYETSFLLFINQIRILLLLTKITEYSDSKLHLNLHLKFRKSKSHPKIRS